MLKYLQVRISIAVSYTRSISYADLKSWMYLMKVRVGSHSVIIHVIYHAIVFGTERVRLENR